MLEVNKTHIVEIVKIHHNAISNLEFSTEKKDKTKHTWSQELKAYIKIVKRSWRKTGKEKP